jgi:nucleotide-binding universal stress UspA family protein
MFKHILVPTDGSKLSQKAIAQSVALAKQTRAALTGVYVMAPFNPAIYGDAALYVPPQTQKEFDALQRREADKALAVIEKKARAAGIAVKKVAIRHSGPSQGIIRTAKAKKCDLIVMASHNRGGLAGLVLGSETAKVLSNSKIPVLVCR